MKFGVFVFFVLMALATSASGEDRVSASWYGDELRGKRTASGEKFNPHGLTAAHRTLPFGTCLVVGNPRNGKSVNVRVNDRGPFVKDRVLDLAAGAADLLVLADAADAGFVRLTVTEAEFLACAAAGGTLEEASLVAPRRDSEFNLTAVVARLIGLGAFAALHNGSS